MWKGLAVLLVPILCGVATDKCPEKDIEIQGRRHLAKTASFDYLLFVQQWPPGECANETEHCRVPQGDPRWTIHGLWPTSNGTEGPNYCFPYTFNLSKIASLIGQLNSSWPDLFTDEPYYCFWKHEYEKHGTCASVLPQFKNEFLFFYNTLVIKNKMDLYLALSNGSILPSKDKTYKGGAIKAALKGAFNNATPYLECKDIDGKQVLFQASFCLNKDTLHVFECEDYVYKQATCWDTDDVTYYPF